MSNKVERRITKSELRAVKEDGKPTSIAGYAAVFNKRSEDLGGFVEEIAPGAFTEVLASGPDCRCLFNHDSNMLLGRTTSGTLSLRQDATGLYYDCAVADTSAGRDVLVLAERGDLNQSSFGFIVDTADGSERWYDAAGKETRKWGGVLRIIHRVKSLMDTAPVVYPAYTDATVEARSKFCFPEGKPEQRQDSQPSLAVNGVGGDKDDCYEEQCFEVQAALNIKFPYEEYYYGGKYCAIETYTDSVIVYDYAVNQYYTIAYTEPTNDVFEFGDPQPVEEAWVASERATKFIAERRAAVAKAIEQRTADKVLAAAVPVVPPAEKRSNDAGCDCDCPECVADNCEECTDETCADPNCVSSEAYIERSNAAEIEIMKLRGKSALIDN